MGWQELQVLLVALQQAPLLKETDKCQEIKGSLHHILPGCHRGQSLREWLKDVEMRLSINKKRKTSQKQRLFEQKLWCMEKCQSFNRELMQVWLSQLEHNRSFVIGSYELFVN